jgi:hypothetical protein
MCARKALIYGFIYFHQFTAESVCYKTKKDKIKGWLAVKFLLKLIKNFNK